MMHYLAKCEHDLTSTSLWKINTNYFKIFLDFLMYYKSSARKLAIHAIYIWNVAIPVAILKCFLCVVCFFFLKKRTDNVTWITFMQLNQCYCSFLFLKGTAQGNMNSFYRKNIPDYYNIITDRLLSELFAWG